MKVLARRSQIAVTLLALSSLFALSIAQAEERLWLDAEVNGKTARLAFDTGCTEMVLFSRGAPRLGVSFTNSPSDARFRPGEVLTGKTETSD
jgi:hypothetical protein